jgi:putative addiction module component (TIGR02574 family)
MLAMTARDTADIINHLSSAERILLAQDLWDSVSDDPDLWALTAEQRRELQRRVKAYRARKAKGGQAGLSWSQVRRRIRARRK